jgi:hypothetical protein
VTAQGRRLRKPSEERRQRPATEDEIVRAEAARPRFDLDDQHAETINNVGGDQNIFLPGRSIILPSGATGTLTPGERAAAGLGLLLFWAGVVLLLLTAWAIVDNVLDAHTLSAHYVSWPWKVGLGLMSAGVVVPRLALRLFGRSAGAG